MRLFEGHIITNDKSILKAIINTIVLHILIQKCLLCNIPIKHHEMLNIAMYDNHSEELLQRFGFLKIVINVSFYGPIKKYRFLFTFSLKKVFFIIE